MPTPTAIQNEVNRHRDLNSNRLKQLVDQQYNTEITRPFLLRFMMRDREDAIGLGRLLFAKGMRLVTPEPQLVADGWRIEVAVKHNLREITQEDFVCDLITMAAGVNGCYECWDFLSEQSAEQTQQHNDVPETH